MQTVAAASEEMAASVQEIVHQVTQSALIATQAVERAQHTDATVQRLAGTAERISSSVAEQVGVAVGSGIDFVSADQIGTAAREAGSVSGAAPMTWS